jgi:hypothetical protein
MKLWHLMVVGVAVSGLLLLASPKDRDFVQFLNNLGYQYVTLNGRDFWADRNCLYNSTFKSSQGDGTVCFNYYHGFYVK